MTKQTTKKKVANSKLVKADRSFIQKAVAAAKSFQSTKTESTTVLKKCSKANLKRAIAELI